MSPYVQLHAFSMLRLNPPFEVLSESERMPEPGIWMGHWLKYYLDEKLTNCIKLQMRVHACRLCCKSTSKQRPRPMCLFGSLEAHFQGASHLLGPRQKQMATALIKSDNKRHAQTLHENLNNMRMRWRALKLSETFTISEANQRLWRASLELSVLKQEHVLAEIRKHFSTPSTN